MNWFFLQIDTLNKSVQALPAAAAPEISIIDMLTKGGVLMIPLALLFVIAIFIFFERLIYIQKAAKIEGNFMNIIRDNIVTGNLAAARSLARNTNNPVARIIDKGIQRIGKSIDAIENSMDNVGQLEMYKLEKNMGVLTVISRAAPIFGFVGTLMGLMQLFSQINEAGGDINLDRKSVV